MGSEGKTLISLFSDFVHAIDSKNSTFFLSVSDFLGDFVSSADEKVLYGVYCAPHDLLLYTSNPDGHRVLDYNLGLFLNSQKLSCSQNGLLFHNICNKPGKGIIPTTFSGVYISTFSGKNLRTFGEYYLPRAREEVLLKNLR